MIKRSLDDGIYEYLAQGNYLVAQFCPVCKDEMGIMPGSRDANCHNCGFKDPCCE